MRAAQIILDFDVGACFLQGSEDLFFSVSRLLYGQILSLTVPKSELYTGLDLWGEGQHAGYRYRESCAHYWENHAGY